MSSQFSYELDERQIRMLMQDAEADYNEALWHKFDELAIIECKSSIDISSYVPKFNLSISRSIIVPFLFIILIGGLSAMLFSFVDFKKKEIIDKETPLVANPENLKKPIATTLKTVKPAKVKAPALKAATLASLTPPAITTKSIQAIPTPHIKTETPVKIAETKPKVEVATLTEIKKDNIDTKKNAVAPIIKKKKRKLKAEELPVISATTILNESVTEPELDLK